MTKNKILIVYPPSGNINREERCQQHFKEYLKLMNLPPTDLLYLAAISEKAGYDVKVKDYGQNNQTIKDFVEDLRLYLPNYVIFDVSLPSLVDDLNLCEENNENSPSTKIIAKGFPFKVDAKGIMAKYTKLDYAIKGDAEHTVYEFLLNKVLSDIDGLVWRSGNVIIENISKKVCGNLDDLPFPARHLIDNTKYTRPDNNKPLAVIRVEKGCPHGCFFCLV